MTAKPARFARPEAMPTRFKGSGRGQVQWTCRLELLEPWYVPVAVRVFVPKITAYFRLRPKSRRL